MTSLSAVRIGQRFKTGSKTYTLLARMTGAAKVKEEPTSRTFTPADGSEAVTADLASTNPYWEPGLDDRITEELQESSGVYSNCGEDFGFSCYERMPLHSACYDRGDY